MSLFFLCITPSWVHADIPSDAPVAEKLEYLTEFLGPNITSMVASNPQYYLGDCVVKTGGESPDANYPDTPGTSRLQAYQEVYSHGGQTTDRNSNAGMRAYMADSVATEPELFRAAFGFFNWLSVADNQWSTAHASELGGDDMVSPIGIDTDDYNIYSQALMYANNNHYLALKILAIYGHDNMENNLFDMNNDCRSKILDLVGPGTPSLLYQSGSIPGVSYSSSQTRAGQRVASSCQRRFQTLATSNRSRAEALYALCNDSRAHYEGDFYHTVAAAFMGCRGQVASNHIAGETIVATLVMGPAPIALDQSAGIARTAAIRSYKVARFQEEINMSAGSLPSTMVAFLNFALGEVAIDVDPFTGAVWTAFNLSASDAEVQMVRAVINRWAHEIQYRQYQNQLGAQYGERQCLRQSTYNNNDDSVGASGGARIPAPETASQPVINPGNRVEQR